MLVYLLFNMPDMQVVDLPFEEQDLSTIFCTLQVDNTCLSKKDSVTGATPLHRAFQKGKFDVVQLFLRYAPKTIITQRDFSGSTIIDYAELSKNQDCIDLARREYKRHSEKREWSHTKNLDAYKKKAQELHDKEY